MHSLRQKNLMKMKDIEVLNEKNEKLKREILNLKEYDKNQQKKIVFIENDNSEILSKAR